MIMARRRFQFEEGRSAKFWEIEVKGNRQIVHYGKLGAVGQKVEKQFAAKDDAKKSAEKLIREKTKKGYREVTSSGAQRSGPTARPTASRKRERPAGTAAGTRLLCEAIYREAERLGADIHGKRELPKSVKRCPEVVAEFYQNIIWPKRSRYSAEIDDRDVDCISFYGPIQEFQPASYGVAGCEGMDLFGVGSRGDNWIFLLNGNDKRKSDPMVYEVDHSPEPGDELNSYGGLSQFLRKLQIEA
jgi:predicted DNA-binding WGR domain protein